jgi:DNA-binding transcriptional MocR family regulator
VGTAIGNGTTQVTACVERIREMILIGELVPGQQLRQTELAQRLKVSRIPLREAMAILNAEGAGHPPWGATSETSLSPRGRAAPSRPSVSRQATHGPQTIQSIVYKKVPAAAAVILLGRSYGVPFSLKGAPYDDYLA